MLFLLKINKKQQAREKIREIQTFKNESSLENPPYTTNGRQERKSGGPGSRNIAVPGDCVATCWTSIYLLMHTSVRVKTTENIIGICKNILF